MYHNNVRGVSSKIKSIEAITKSVLENVLDKDEHADDQILNVITLNEINLRKNKKVNIEG